MRRIGSASRRVVPGTGRVIAAAALLAAMTATPALAQQPGFEQAPPSSVGLSEDGLARATETLRGHVEAGDVAGIVAAVVRDGKLVYAEALGHRDLEAGTEMPFDALFRIYSMTRPVTALGVLMLHEATVLERPRSSPQSLEWGFTA